MPDIAMCDDDACPSREQCFRYRAVPGHWQSHASFNRHGEERCEYFMEIEGRPVLSLRKIEHHETTEAV